MIFLQLVLQNDFGSFCWKSVFCMSHQRQHDCSSVILAAQLKNAATQGSFRCNVRSREEHEFKLRAKLFSNSCCESPIHSYTLLCILYFFFFFMKPQWEFCTWNIYRVSIIYAVKIRGEKLSSNVILYSIIDSALCLTVTHNHELKSHRQRALMSCSVT